MGTTQVQWRDASSKPRKAYKDRCLHIETSTDDAGIQVDHILIKWQQISFHRVTQNTYLVCTDLHRRLNVPSNQGLQEANTDQASTVVDAEPGQGNKAINASGWLVI